MPMKISLVQARAEGFVSRYGLKTDDGLVLTTYDNLLWAGADKRAEVARQFGDFVRALCKAGIKVEGTPPDEAATGTHTKERAQ